MFIDSTRLVVAIERELHGAAYETFVSSVLAAALTENQRFCEWVAVTKADLDPKFFQSTWGAFANDPLPRCLRTDGHAALTDITLRDISADESWESFRDDRTPAEQARHALAAVFVEVKLEYLSREDSEKYCKRVDEISDHDNFRFLLITNRHRWNLDAIKQKPCCKCKSDDKPWRDLLLGGVNVLTYDEVLEALNKDLATSGEPSSELPATAFARDYFRVLQCRAEVPEYWGWIIYCTAICAGKDRGGNHLREQIIWRAIEMALATQYLLDEPKLPTRDRKNQENNHLKLSTIPASCTLTRCAGRAEPTKFFITVSDLEESPDDVTIEFDLQTKDPLHITEKFRDLKKALTDIPRVKARLSDLDSGRTA